MTREDPQSPAPAEVQPSAEDEAVRRTEEAAKSKAAKKKSDLIKASRRRLEMAKEDAAAAPVVVSEFPTSTVLVSIGILAGGIGLLVWRKRRHATEMELTAVTESSPLAGATGGRQTRTVFSADTLAKIEWKRFQEVVEAYYCKTGFVASRTKAGPKTPVHIRISWKGEPRPFACVRCISHQEGLIEIGALQELTTVLEAEDIRRGYVVTTGRFSVAARDFAEIKHLTLLSGDILLEKLNALPEPARAEIMQTVMEGDPYTPSCPVCEAKMLRSKEAPGLWRCAVHANATFAARD